ncbi:condensation domain-containing protein, partial [Burkholderia ubonensis]|uniref:condensation domain-containing protein n=1 Tax=Burkholderia ubonensis TaxID=101571 RepID=UPI0012FADE73
DRSQPLPLSLAQQRLWFLDQFEDTGAAYHIPGGLRLRGELNLPALQATLDRILARHESLRTTFSSVDGQPVQHIGPAASFALRHADLSPLALPAREAALSQLAAEEASGPFDLARGPLIRGALVRLQPDEHVLLVTMHHIVSDGWSISVLVREVAALYPALLHERPVPLPPLTIQYADYALWQRARLSGPALQQQAEYWRNQLAGSPVLLTLPTDRARPPVQSYAGDHVSLGIDSALASRLHALARQHDVTLFMTLLAAWASLLARLAGQDDIVIGAPVANRQHAEVEPLIGLFINTVALRVDLSDDPSVAALLQRVRHTTLAAYAHQDIPFEQVVEAVQPSRSLSHSPLFQVMFALQNTPHSELELPGLSLSPYTVARHTAQFDLTLSLEERNGTLCGSIEYASDLFERPSVERLAAHFTTLLASMVDDPSRSIGSLQMLDAAERHQLLEGFNDTRRDYPNSVLLHELFEQQVRLRPDAPAACFEAGQLSYDALNRRANQLARHLRELGVGPDTLVAICAERSLEMVVALLAVLKAGGAYVPLDPAYPPERLHYMLQDAQPRVLLTQHALRERLPDTDAPVFTLDLDWHHIAHL